MALYKFPEESLLSILSHIPSYGLSVIQLSSEMQDGALIYTLEITGDIPEEELPHLINGNGLEVI